MLSLFFSMVMITLQKMLFMWVYFLKILWKLQLVQNSTVRLLIGTSNYGEYLSSVLNKLHALASPSQPTKPQVTQSPYTWLRRRQLSQIFKSLQQERGFFRSSLTITFFKMAGMSLSTRIYCMFPGPSQAIPSNQKK